MHDTWWMMHSRSPVHLLKMSNKNREHCVLADMHHFVRDWQTIFCKYCLTSSFISVAMRRQVMWFGGCAAAYQLRCVRCTAVRPQCSSCHVLFASLCACRAFQNRWMSLRLIMSKTGSDNDIQQRWRKTWWQYLSALCNMTMKPAVFSTYSPTQTHKHTQAHTSTHRHTQAHTNTHTHTRTHAHTHTRTHAHTHTRKWTHSHVHTDALILFSIICPALAPLCRKLAGSSCVLAFSAGVRSSRCYVVSYSPCHESTTIQLPCPTCTAIEQGLFFPVNNTSWCQWLIMPLSKYQSVCGCEFDWWAC